MRRAEGGQIELIQRNVQPGHDADHVLFEQFGILYPFDKEPRELLERHRKLLQAGALPDHAERVDLGRRLAARLGRVSEVLTILGSSDRAKELRQSAVPVGHKVSVTNVRQDGGGS